MDVLVVKRKRTIGAVKVQRCRAVLARQLVLRYRSASGRCAPNPRFARALTSASSARTAAGSSPAARPACDGTASTGSAGVGSGATRGTYGAL